VTIHDAATWKCEIEIAKFLGEWVPGAIPYDVVKFDGNMLLCGGVSALWQALVGNGTTSANQALTYFNNANAAIGVGDSAVAAAATQTDLQGTNKVRKGMNASYPQHTDGTGTANKTITFQCTFQTNEANFAWEEAGVFNSPTAGVGRMINRRQQAMGAKTAASSWQVTLTITID
jgi:hypothetical protein